MKLEAYLGPNAPETLATGEVYEGAAAHVVCAVVKFLREGDHREGKWVGAYAKAAPAFEAVKRHTTTLHYAVLCSVRPAQSELTERFAPLDELLVETEAEQVQADEEWLAAQNQEV